MQLADNPPINNVDGDFFMLEQELAMAHETIEDADNYESVVDAIQIEWIEQALLETIKRA